jgi:hypothetical protein
MPLTCVSTTTTNINKPSSWTDTPTSAQIQAKPVFILNGAPISNKPQSLRNLGERVLKSNSANKPPSERRSDDYWWANLASENIIGSDTKTTLRYENQTYTQKFIAIHTGIWGEPGLYVTLFLMAANNDMFHICIPVSLTTTPQDENVFLKSWLNNSNTDPFPSGFTTNDLLNFRGVASPSPMVDFTIINDCLSYNNKSNLIHYTLCKFKTRLNLNNGPNQNLVGAWINPSRMSVAELPVESTPAVPYRRKTFNQIFNFMLNGIIVNALDRNMVDNTSKYITESPTPTSGVTPIFYSVSLADMKSGASSSASGASGSITRLQNVKCYPIDLVQQVDDQGNIFIDQATNKPIDITTVNASQFGLADPSLGAAGAAGEAAALAARQNQNWQRFMIVFCVIFGLIAVGICVLLYYNLFKGRTYLENPTGAASGAGAGAASGAGAGVASGAGAGAAGAAGVGFGAASPASAPSLPSSAASSLRNLASIGTAGPPSLPRIRIPPSSAASSLRNLGSAGSAGNLGSIGNLGSTGNLGNTGNLGSIGSLGNTGSTGSSLVNIGNLGNLGVGSPSPIVPGGP